MLTPEPSSGSVLLAAALVASLAAAVAAVAAVAAGAPSVVGDARAPFQEQVVVRELEVDFDPTALPPLESLGRRADRDFLVLENGLPLEQVAPRAGEAGDGDDEREPDEEPCPIAELLVWFDPDLASPRARAGGARALASAAMEEVFPTCVPISLVVDGHGREVSISSPTLLGVELGRRARDWESTSAEARSPLAGRLRALDRLNVALARRGGGGRRALFVVGDGWPVDGELINTLAGLERGDDGPGVDRLRPIEDAARVAAAFGWTSYVLAAVVPLDSEVRPGPERRPESRIHSGGRESSSWMVRLFAPRHHLRSAAREEARLELATDLTLRPWAHFVRAGAGTLLADAGAVASQLERLAGRRRLVVRSPDPGPGRLLPLEVRWTGGDGRSLPARRWSRSGQPPEAVSARLRALAAGDLDPALGARVHLEVAGASSAPHRICLVGSRAHAFVRAATWSAAAEAGVAIGPVLAAGPGPVDEACAPLPEAATSGFARASEPSVALIEDPESGEWGALRLAGTG